MADIAAENLAAAQDAGTPDGQPEVEPLDPTYVAEAADWGLNDPELLRAVPREAFQRMKAAADARVFDQVRRVSAFEQPTQQPNQPPQHEQQPQQPSAFALDPFELKFEESEVAESPFAKGLTAQQKWSADQIGKLNTHYAAELRRRDADIASLREQQDYGILDRYIDALGPEWSGEFGKGSTLDFEPQSREFLKRGELRTAAITAMRIYQATTGRRLPASQALPQALGLIYRDKVAAQERAKADAERKKLQAGVTAKPRASGSNPPVSGIRGRASMVPQNAR